MRESNKFSETKGDYSMFNFSNFLISFNFIKKIDLFVFYVDLNDCTYTIRN